MFESLKRFAVIVALGGCLTAHAADETPDVLIKNVTSEVIELIKTDKAIQAGDTKHIQEVVESKILKYFDFNKMTGSAVGREWRNATPDQKAQLSKEFQTLLVRSYSNALTQYKNQTVDVKPLKAAAADTEVTVKTEVKQPGGKPVAIDYDLIKAADGWKVFDIYVAGVSLVANYRDTFGQEIKANGIDGLIKSLHDKNTAKVVEKK
ncbi:ABC transporter substrate-binding protein [Uliginosibacterium sp. H3]|uniref:ABC transporter substrate-binding protein n=1 Tax=Uliginosibacterium silvisoli TaxID=3114758 RepID=A0ABU6K4Q9_9RHOO|nr:ABC transporter substrate-binding protein [Uliginosibacterium sp. H3]